jgi:trimethylamine--corrinoid protein Co-methyltransferase
MSTEFRVLSEDQCDLIYRSALEILARTGVTVYDPEGLELLEAAGAELVGEHGARLPAEAVQSALAQAPSTIRMVGRDPDKVCRLERDMIHYGTGSDCPFIRDRKTNQRRQWTYEEVRDAARVSEALENTSFHMSLGLTAGVPAMSYDRHQFLAMLEGTTKPLVQTAVDRAGLRDQYEMACVIRGSEKAFELAPLLTLYAEPTSPLSHTQTATEKLLFAAEKRIPCIYTPCPIAGATSPMTGAGTLVVALAETLSGNVMAQQKAPGARIIGGGVVSIMDMRDMIYSYGAPELALFSAAYTDVLKHLGLPVFSTAGCSDAKLVDQQAAIEGALSLLFAGLSGANLIHDVGYLESGLLGSYEMLVLSDEIIGMVKQICRGIPVDEETLAVSVIEEVGPAGQFLTQDHTLKHYRNFWQPQHLIRCGFERWQKAGSMTLGERITKRVDEILETQETEPIPEDQMQELRRIVEAADREATAHAV